jgi:hypothetical protein
VVDNIPFFEREATIGDVICAREKDGQLWFDFLVRPSGSSLIRVIVFLPDRISKIRQRLRTLGCASEEFGPKPIIAIDIPSETALEPIRNYLDHLEKKDVATYEEAIIRH